jgi:Rieske Fe-S protein
MNSAVTRRELLVLAQGGMTCAAFAGCAVIRGGAQHSVVPPADQQLEGNRLRIPVATLAGVGAGEVREVKPGGGYPELLLLAPAPGGSWRAVTAHCPHKGCVVGWNATAVEWQCPCHGSRFGADGQLFQGPATRPLSAAPVHVDDGVLVIDLGGLTA